MLSQEEPKRSQSEFKYAVADYTTKSFLEDENGRRFGVLIVSNSVNPDLVQRSVVCAAEVRISLGEDLGAVILKPLGQGRYENLSYVIWPMLRLFSESRIVLFLQEKLIIPKLLTWMRAAIDRSRSSVDDLARVERYARPLEAVSGDERFSSSARSAAEKALDRMITGQWTPVTTFQHGDLWVGNVLLPASGVLSNRHGFFLIDWAGGLVAAQPCFDLLRMGLSFRLAPTRLRAELEAYSEILGGEIEDMMGYLLAGLGDLGFKLEHFPEERYVLMCRLVVDLLAEAAERPDWRWRP